MVTSPLCPECKSSPAVVGLFSVWPCDDCSRTDSEVAVRQPESSPIGLSGPELHNWMRENPHTWLRWGHGNGVTSARWVIRGHSMKDDEYWERPLNPDGTLSSNLGETFLYKRMTSSITCTGIYEN